MSTDIRGHEALLLAVPRCFCLCVCVCVCVCVEGVVVSGNHKYTEHKKELDTVFILTFGGRNRELQNEAVKARHVTAYSQTGMIV